MIKQNIKLLNLFLYHTVRKMLYLLIDLSGLFLFVKHNTLVIMYVPLFTLLSQRGKVPFITCRHRQQCGDGQREGGAGLGGGGQRGRK